MPTLNGDFRQRPLTAGSFQNALASYLDLLSGIKAKAEENLSNQQETEN